MAAESWRDLVDLDRLAAWMDRQELGEGQIEDPQPLGGGTQNILLHFQRAGRDYVLRRPPRHPRMDGSETMRREARLLAALAGTEVPHPRLIAACPENEVLGAAFYLMEPVDGFNATTGLPPLHAGDPALRHAMGLALVDGIAALGRVDPFAVGLEGFGKLDGFLDRQVGRWRAQLESYRDYPGWPGPDSIPGIETVAAWLAAHQPKQFTPGIIHGDYHLANVLFQPDGPGLAAIVDWELATLGDPLIDLGWLLATWPDPASGRPGIAPVTPWDGFPTAEELVARYEAGSARDLSAVGWYAVLACYKLGILLEGTHARAFAGKAAKETGDRLHASTVALFERALGWIDGYSPDTIR
jgi:aminoglycoside phosphotransferase (APT) family kinase protein